MAHFIFVDNSITSRAERREISQPCRKKPSVRAFTLKYNVFLEFIARTAAGWGGGAVASASRSRRTALSRRAETGPVLRSQNDRTGAWLLRFFLVDSELCHHFIKYIVSFSLFDRRNSFSHLSALSSPFLKIFYFKSNKIFIYASFTGQHFCTFS